MMASISSLDRVARGTGLSIRVDERDRDVFGFCGATALALLATPRDLAFEAVGISGEGETPTSTALRMAWRKRISGCLDISRVVKRCISHPADKKWMAQKNFGISWDLPNRGLLKRKRTTAC